MAGTQSGSVATTALPWPPCSATLPPRRQGSPGTWQIRISFQRMHLPHEPSRHGWPHVPAPSFLAYCKRIGRQCQAHPPEHVPDPKEQDHPFKTCMIIPAFHENRGGCGHLGPSAMVTSSCKVYSTSGSDTSITSVTWGSRVVTTCPMRVYTSAVRTSTP